MVLEDARCQKRVHVISMCACDSLADVLSIQRACNGQGRDLDVAVEHPGVVWETTGVSGAKMRISILNHLLRIRWEIDIAAYRSGELGEEVSGESSSAFFKHGGNETEGGRG